MILLIYKHFTFENKADIATNKLILIKNKIYLVGLFKSY